MTENERGKFESEIKVLRDDKVDLMKKLTSLSETDEIRRGMENLSMMFLHKQTDENLLTSK